MKGGEEQLPLHGQGSKVCVLVFFLMSGRRLEGGGGIRCVEMGIVSLSASSRVCVRWKPDGARGPHSFIRNFLMFWQRNGFMSVGENKN